jgi:flagellar basal body-associated protein FliL
MRRLAVLLAIGLVLVAAAAAGALAVRSLSRATPPAPTTTAKPTKAQLAARKRLAAELATYGCACQHHTPPVNTPPTHAP